jgi:hypothetical protein
MQAVTAIVVVLLAWGVVGGACIGWGAALMRLLLRRTPATPGPAVLFWAGFATLLGLLQVWHLFLAVDWRATAGLIGAGWIAFFLMPAARRSLAFRLSVSGIFVLAVVGLWLAFRALDFPRNYDSGLYHFASIRWIGEFQAVPGLANLHDRLAFNQSYFLFVALLNAHPFSNEGYHAANSLLWFALCAQLLAAAWPQIRPAATATQASLLSCCLLPVLIMQAATGDISSPTPDVAVFAVSVAAFLFAARSAETAAPEFPAVLPVLLVAGCTIKFSFIAFAAGMTAVLWWAGRQPDSPLGSGALVRRLAFSAGALGVPFAIRGIILSGYPAYPVPYFALPVDWALPAAEARAAAQWIAAWARAPGLPYEEVLGSWAWFPAWSQRLAANSQVMLTLELAAIAASVIMLARVSATARPTTKAGAISPSLLLLPIVIGLGFWFFTAPDPRFALWLFWLLAAWLLTWALWVAGARAKFSVPRALAFAGLAASAIAMACGPWPGTQPLARGLRSFHRVQLREFVTESGLRVLVPAEDVDRLWDSPLPSTPYTKSRLQLRGASLREGFRTAPAPTVREQPASEPLTGR